MNRLLKRIKFKIDQFNLIDRKIGSIRTTQEDTFCLSILLKMFDQNFFLLHTSWSLSPKEVLHICNDIIINKRREVVEFGSGLTTVFIAQLIKVKKLNIKFYSVENNLEWISETKIALSELELISYVEFVHAPIVTVEEKKYKNQSKWYDMNVLNLFFDKKKIDVIIVDGPPSKYSPYSRFSALPFMVNFLAEDFAIFLDDYRRPQEKEIVTEWIKIKNFQLYDFDRYAYLTNKQVFESEPITPKIF